MTDYIPVDVVMSVQGNLHNVQQMYSDLGDSNIDAESDSMADDVVWKQPTDGPELFAGTVQGREQLGEWFGQMDEMSDIEAFDVQDYFAKGCRVKKPYLRGI